MFNTKIIGADAVTTGNGLVDSLIVATQTVKLYTVVIFNTGGADKYFMIFDAVAVPANATVPKIPPIRVPANSQGSFDFPDGRVFAAGVVVVGSTTVVNLTKGAADNYIDATWRVI